MAYFSCSFSNTNPCDYYDASTGMSNQAYYQNQYAQEYADTYMEGSKLQAMSQGVQDHTHAFNLMNNHFDLYDRGTPKNASSSNPYYATYKIGDSEHAVAVTGYDKEKNEYITYDPSTCGENRISGSTHFTSSYLVKPKSSGGINDSSYYEDSYYAENYYS